MELKLPTGKLNEEGLKDLFHKYYGKLYSNFLAKTKAPDIASDLTQETFIRLWKYRASFSNDIAPDVQLYRKAKQVLIDWLRREAHQRKIAQEIGRYKPDKETSKLELTDLLKKAIDQLPAMRRKVFLMSYVDGFSNREIAEELKISIRTVEGHVQKALYELRKSLTWQSILLWILINQSIR